MQANQPISAVAAHPAKGRVDLDHVTFHVRDDQAVDCGLEDATILLGLLARVSICQWCPRFVNHPGPLSDHPSLARSPLIGGRLPVSVNCPSSCPSQSPGHPLHADPRESPREGTRPPDREPTLSYTRT